jgi:SAM-dependent methyltransferase
MGLGFGGEVAGFYARYRRGYPAVVLDAVVGAFELTSRDVVVDIGCRTGQLTLPLARRVRAVVGMDPELDMLALARRAAGAANLLNISWVLGADTDVPGLAALLGPRSVAAVTIGTALHWMRPEDLFPALVPLLRPGGGVAVLTNGVPLWSQDTAWSRRLRQFLHDWLGHRPRPNCGSDPLSHQENRRALLAAGYTDITETTVVYRDELDADHVIGQLCSAMPADRPPPPADRPAFTDGVRRALGSEPSYTDHVEVTTLLGHAP